MLQNGNAKIYATGKVHPRQSSSRPSAVQTSRMGCPRKQARQDVLLRLPWTVKEDNTQNPNLGEARHATRQGSRQKNMVLTYHVVLHTNER